MSPVVAKNDSDAFYRWAVSEISEKNKGNSALILIQDGKVTQEHFSSSNELVDEHTLFPTASFSKWIAALGVMSLVEDNLIDLDAPVSQYLTRWQLPDSEFNNADVTTRRLLSHTAGLTDKLGFGDYLLEEEIPRLEEELRQPRASNGADALIAVGIEPGSEFIYSGGGYLILQLLVEEVSGVRFEDYIQSVVFDPLAMERSTYQGHRELENTSSSFNLNGSLAPSYQYASAAATGLASSASDLAKLANSLLQTVDKTILNQTTIETMREPHGFVLGAGIWGLGTILYAPTPGGRYVFGHDGANDPAINASVRLNPDTSDGMILLVSGHPSLASNIGSEWVLWQTGYPDFLQTEQALRSALIPFLIGCGLILLAVFLSARRSS